MADKTYKLKIGMSSGESYETNEFTVPQGEQGPTGSRGATGPAGPQGPAAPQTYDTIISAQEEFDAWCAEIESGSYLGKSVLILDGTYNRTNGKMLTIPISVYTIDAIGNVIINYDAPIDDICLGYSELPDKKHSIRGITISLLPSDTKATTAFSNFINLENCHVVVRGSTSYNFAAFEKCEYLSSCTVEGNGKGVVSFTYSNYLFGCSSDIDCTGVLTAFYRCNYLIGCSSKRVASSAGRHFHYCTSLVNCVVEGNFPAYVFCSMCSNCGYTGEKPTNMFVRCTNVDPNTCPDYTPE